MGLFDFLKGKSKVEEVTSIPKTETETSQHKKQEPVLEVKSVPVKSKTKVVDSIKDIDGNVYKTVKIGDQVWTAENLKTTKYNDGTSISLIKDDDEWGNDRIGAYCYYDNDSAANAEKYGALYNWHAVNTGKLAPKGWHVPTVEEWIELEENLIANGYNWDGTTEVNKISKSMASKSDWYSNNDNGTIGNDLSLNNRSGFSALPGGSRGNIGRFNDQGGGGGWWSATEADASSADGRFLTFGNDGLRRNFGSWEVGFSVRLVRD